MATQAQPDPISLATVLIEPFFNGQDLGVSGTGFVIRTRKGPFLVTAGHVLTGRHPDGKCLHSKGALPNQVTLSNFFGPLVKAVSLYLGKNDPNDDPPHFKRHPEKLYDVAILPLPMDAARFEVNFLHESLWRPETMARSIPTLDVGDQCHIIGYPEGLMNRVGEGRVLPLWKTGHLATDPHYDFTNTKIGFEKAPLCLIDATTRPGQSGAPVFVVIDDPGFRRRSRLIGIYSGRTSDSSDIGIAWRPSVIHELLEKNFPGW